MKKRIRRPVKAFSSGPGKIYGVLSSPSIKETKVPFNKIDKQIADELNNLK